MTAEFVAFWPIRDTHQLNTRTGRETLLIEAAHDLPNVARRAHSRITGTPRFRFSRGWEHPGAGAYDHILAVRVPAEPTTTPTDEP